MGFLIFVGVLVSSAWVYSDAKSRNSSSPVLWAIGSFLFWIVIFPMYLICRPSRHDLARQDALMNRATPRPRLCPHCGKYYEPPANFCPNCGNKV